MVGFTRGYLIYSSVRSFFGVFLGVFSVSPSVGYVSIAIDPWCEEDWIYTELIKFSTLPPINLQRKNPSANWTHQRRKIPLRLANIQRRLSFDLPGACAGVFELARGGRRGVRILDMRLTQCFAYCKRARYYAGGFLRWMLLRVLPRIFLSSVIFCLFLGFLEFRQVLGMFSIAIDPWCAED